FPAFSDEKTLARFRLAPPTGPLEMDPETARGSGCRNGAKRGAHKRCRAPFPGLLAHEVEHVAWLLGINFTVQLVPADGERILQVLAGHSEAVERRGRQLYQAAWNYSVARRASLVVAGVEGGPRQQTWEALGRAMEAAAALVEEGGAIAVCCDLGGELGPAMRRLAKTRSRESALRQIRKTRPGDALPALQLARVLQRDHVYLLSRLDPCDVEALDMVPLAGPAELARLTRQHPSCILLSNASRAMVSVASNGEE
ncbi:MAG: hypothetical protein ABSG68_25260, partial [Thermoguttaceae bacterium]